MQETSETLINPLVWNILWWRTWQRYIDRDTGVYMDAGVNIDVDTDVARDIGVDINIGFPGGRHGNPL